MAKVTGIGGVFFKVADKDGALAWMRDNLGLAMQDWGTVFPWRERDDPDKKGVTALGVFPEASTYFEPGTAPIMINFRVDDLAGLLADLRAKGATVIKELPDEPNGRFAHVLGPEGIGFELWEPKVPDPYDP